MKPLIFSRRMAHYSKFVLNTVLHPFIIYRTQFESTGSFKKSFTSLKAYVNLFRGHVQYFELS
jgi:hypothetical protein